MRSQFETYTRYFGVDDEKQKRSYQTYLFNGTFETNTRYYWE